MTKRATAVTLILAVLATLLVFAPAVCSAAPAGDKPIKMTVQISINTPKTFWSYPYITRDDGKIRMPAAIMVEWSTTSGVNSSRGTVVQAGEKRGEYVITTERNAYVDIEAQVVDDKKVVLGKGSMQVRNTGQVVQFTVYLPDATSPSLLTE